MTFYETQKERLKWKGDKMLEGRGNKKRKFKSHKVYFG
jgi:hypothetical protein